MNYTIVEAIKRKYLLKFDSEYFSYVISPWVYGIPINDENQCVKGLVLSKGSISYLECRSFFINKISNIRIIPGDFMYPSGQRISEWRRIFIEI